MKKYVLGSMMLLTLGACQDSASDAAPSAIAAEFNQDFALNYRQQATLPTASLRELTLVVTDIQYSFCPKNARCFTADFVAPTVQVTDAQGQTQQVKMPANQPSAATSNWIDTTSLRANGRRYTLYYKRWIVTENVEQPQRKDLTVVLHVAR